MNIYGQAQNEGDGRISMTIEEAKLLYQSTQMIPILEEESLSYRRQIGELQSELSLMETTLINTSIELEQARELSRKRFWDGVIGTTLGVGIGLLIGGIFL